jgi:hypothetical protein
LAKAGDSDFLRQALETALQMLMGADVEGKSTCCFTHEEKGDVRFQCGLNRRKLLLPFLKRIAFFWHARIRVGGGWGRARVGDSIGSSAIAPLSVLELRENAA